MTGRRIASALAGGAVLATLGLAVPIGTGGLR